MGDVMRWFEDDLDDDGTKPYREGNVYVCRSCACSMKRKQSLCGRCHRHRNEQVYEVGIDENHSDD